MNSSAYTLCLKCNEFYGSPDTKGLCSHCFKLFSNEFTPATTEEKETVEPVKEVSSTVIEESPEQVIEEEPKPIERPVQTNKNACWKCSKMVGYLGFKCNCDYIFCSTHRHFKDHECDFDFKSHDRAKLKSRIEKLHGQALK